MVNRPPDDIEFPRPDPASARTHWAFLSHSADDTPFLQREVVPDRPEHFFLMDYRTHSEGITEVYRRKILQALSRCAWFLVAVSDAAVTSAWVRFEVRWALQHRRTERMRVLVLSEADPSQIAPGLASIQRIDFRDSTAEGRRLLRSAMREVFETDGPPI